MDDMQPRPESCGSVVACEPSSGGGTVWVSHGVLAAETPEWFLMVVSPVPKCESCDGFWSQFGEPQKWIEMVSLLINFINND